MKFPKSIYAELFPIYKNHSVFKTVNRYASTGVNLFSNTEPTTAVRKEIETYWKDKINLNLYDETDNSKEKFYALSMFPYPSGMLHMGHIRVYTISDSVARFYRMIGYNVLHPMGWDAFGLPAENAAIEKRIDPHEWTQGNISKMREQLKVMNYAFDWDREFATCDPEYYKWTQEIFLKLYERGLVYQKEAFVNWDPVDETVLAEEQIDENNCSWRSGAKVEKRLLNQWFIRTTPFANGEFNSVYACTGATRFMEYLLSYTACQFEKSGFEKNAFRDFGTEKALYEGLSNPKLKEWADIIKMQRNWIGECTGVSFDFQLISDNANYPKTINVWTKTPEFIEFAEFVAISPNSPLNQPENCRKVQGGIEIMDAKVLNPFSGEELPIFVTDKIVFQPFRDTHIGIPSASMEDFQFLEIVGIRFRRHTIKSYDEQQKKLAEKLLKARQWKIGGYPVSPRLQDWLISRQRYWGTPIPVVHCSNCGAQPVPRDQLPVVLPKLEFSKEKKSTLTEAAEWLNTSCPKCGGKAIRESDTMDTFVDSSWYFLRFVDPKNARELFDTEKTSKIFPVNLYVGGKEHGVLHLYYARFMSYFLHSEGLLPTQEPFLQLLVQGMVMGKTYQVKNSGRYLRPEEVEEEGGKYVVKATKEEVNSFWEKMSKSKHNGVDPLELLDKYGIDTTRLLILADVAPTSNRNWSDSTIPGILNWQNRIWRIVKNFTEYRNSVSLEELKNEPTNSKFSKDDEYMFDSRNYFLKTVTFNITTSQQLSVAISRMQGLTNSLHKVSAECLQKSKEFERALAVQIIMLAPLAPHFASELWAAFSSVKHHLINEDEVQLNKDVMQQTWPTIDQNYNMQLSLVINHKFCKKYKMPRNELDKLTEEAAADLVNKDPEVQKKLKGRKIEKVILISKAGCDGKMIVKTEKGKNIQLKETLM